MPLGITAVLLSGARAGERVDVRSEGSRVTVTRGALVLVFDPMGRGFVTSARLGDVEACTGSKESGLFATVLRPRGGTRPLEPIHGEEVAGNAAVESVEGKQVGAEGRVTISGHITFPDAPGAPEAPGAPAAPGANGASDATGSPFVVRVTVPQDGPAMAVSVELEVARPWRKSYLTSFGLAVPLELGLHPTSAMGSEVDRKTVAAAILPRAGVPTPEIRWMVARQDEKDVWGPMLWTLAGVRQVTPVACEVWEAWTTKNPQFVLQHHRVHPGWMAVADGRLAVAAGMPGIEKVAPKEIYADSQAGVLRICFQSPYCRPLDLGAAPEKLSAGPAYVFIEAAQESTRAAEAYREAKRRPALALVGDTLAGLPPTQCNFGRAELVESPPRNPLRPVPKSDPSMAPADSEFVSHEPATPTEITIWVDEPQGVDFESYPVTRGIPLGKGALVDEKKVALFDAAGRRLACAPRAIAYWPDRSVKWLLLDFQVRLAAGEGAKLKLVVGGEAAPVSVPKPLRVIDAPGSITPDTELPGSAKPEGKTAGNSAQDAKSPGGTEPDGKAVRCITVDTGMLKATFTDRGGKLALTVGLDLNGDGNVADDETVVEPGPQMFGCAFSHIADSERYVSRSWLDPGEPDPGTAEVEELRVEESSPLRAVVLVRANLGHGLLASTIDPKHRPPAGTPVSLRFHLYAGSSMVRVTHTFLFAGDVRFDFLREIGLRLPLPARPGQTIRTSIDGLPIDLAREGESGLLQETADSGLVWQAEGRRAKVLRLGSMPDGWLDVSTERWGVTVGLRHMREMFPQEIHVDGEGIWTHFYPPRVQPMDVRRYAFKYGDGESTSTGFGSAFGALRTHEACWFFHPGAEEAARGAAQVREVLEPPLVRVRPRHVADTLAAGHVAEHGAATNDRHLDDVLYHLPRMHLHNRDFWRWFGFWDFGDEIQVYDAGGQRWAKDDGRYGWYNNEPVRDYNYHLAFLMTGNRRIWEQAEAMSLHVFEVDVRHASPQPFMSAGGSLGKQAYDHSTTSGIDICGRRHNCQHWADGYFGPRVGSPPGFRLSYYQTGDPVMGEYLGRILAAALKTRRSQYMGADGDEAILWAMILGYEMTLDPKYLDRIRAYVNLQVEFAKANKGFPAAQANWDWASNAPGAPAGDPREELWIWSFGGHLALIEAAELLQDPAATRLLNEWVLAMEGLGSDGKRRESWSDDMAACPLLAHYYRTTGDVRALDWCQHRLKRFHSGIPEEAPRIDLPAETMGGTFPAYTPHDGYGWVYTTTTFWYVGISAWQGALRERAVK